jgi:hypothetical protein
LEPGKFPAAGTYPLSLPGQVLPEAGSAIAPVSAACWADPSSFDWRTRNRSGTDAVVASPEPGALISGRYSGGIAGNPPSGLFSGRGDPPLVIWPRAAGRGRAGTDWADLGPDCGGGRRCFSGTEGTEERR